jgi:hypothetical protein
MPPRVNDQQWFLSWSLPTKGEEKHLLGTDLNLGASFDRESSATGSSRTVPAELRAYPHLARHAVKCAEEPRIRIVSWQS